MPVTQYLPQIRAKIGLWQVPCPYRHKGLVWLIKSKQGCQSGELNTLYGIIMESGCKIAHLQDGKRIQGNFQ